LNWIEQPGGVQEIGHDGTGFGVDKTDTETALTLVYGF
jgi:hypothetical protein